MPLINPHPAALGAANAVVGGRGVRRYEHRFAGPLSVKCVISGAAVWETEAGRFELVPGAVLLVNDGEEYEISVDALQPVETFCFFFARGFVEDVWRASVSGSAELLDDPRPRAMGFAEKVQFDGPLVAELREAHARMRRGEEFDESFWIAAQALVRARCDLEARVARLPALRAATREELARRVNVATAFLHAHLDRKVSIEEAARAACLSPFHFHRLFSALHGITPHRYLTKLRLERARALLRQAGRGVAEVAGECGFESTTSFTALFKRTFGTTPGAIRKNEEARRARPR
jgi:AraC family transcriptional regulator